MLWLGATATATVDIAYAARYGLVGAVISAWPTMAFPGTVEMATQVVRRSRTRRATATDPSGRAAGRDAELIAAGIRIRGQADRDGVLLSRKAFAGKVREHGYTIANGRQLP
jgi:hypothetical protein